MGIDFDWLLRYKGKLEFIIQGNTFPVKEVLKDYHCQWDPEQGQWNGKLSRNDMNLMIERILQDACPAGIKIIIAKNEKGKKEGINL